MGSNRDNMGRPGADYPDTTGAAGTAKNVGKNTGDYDDMIDPVYKSSSDRSFDRVSGSTGMGSTGIGSSTGTYGTSSSSYVGYGDRFVTGLFHSRDDAEKAWHELVTRHGIQSENITVLMTDETRNRYFKANDIGKDMDRNVRDAGFNDNKVDSRGMDRDTKVLEGTGVGSAIGGTLGAIVGGIAAIGSNLLIPGLGLVVAGPIAAALAGAGAGGAVGGLIGALAGAGIPEDRAKEYEHSLKSGGIMVGAHVKGDAQASDVEKTLRRFGADRVEG